MTFFRKILIQIVFSKVQFIQSVSAFQGIYRTCGVKSKVEQICEEFEKAKSHKDVNLSGYHPMNIASVVKLYLRQLPQPLLTQELYSDWVSFAEVASIGLLI